MDLRLQVRARELLVLEWPVHAVSKMVSDVGPARVPRVLRVHV